MIRHGGEYIMRHTATIHFGKEIVTTINTLKHIGPIFGYTG